MSDIPEDVMKAAQSVYDALESVVERDRDTSRAADDVKIIAIAILAERERCATIVENHDIATSYDSAMGEAYAAAVRSGV